MRSAFLDFGSLGPADLDTGALTATLPGITLFPTTAPGEVMSRLTELDLVLINKVRIGAVELGAATKLRYIGLAATGTDNIDLAATGNRDIAVTNIRNYGGPSVAQHVFGLILSLTLRLGEYQALLRSGAWQRSEHFCLLDLPTRELAGRTLGIIGHGHLGRAVGQLGRAFGMRVIANRSQSGLKLEGDAVDRLEFRELLRVADIVSLHCPLTPGTRHLLNAESLALMKPDALLINTARGGLVDSQALLAALQQGRLGGAGIDVLAEEPPSRSEPLLAANLPNLLVTPHIAWAARESRQRALDEVVANVRDFLAGGRRNRV